MDELVNVVSQKSGLPQEQSRAAAQAVFDFLTTPWPAPVGEQVTSALTGGGNLRDMAKGLGGMFSKK